MQRDPQLAMSMRPPEVQPLEEPAEALAEATQQEQRNAHPERSCIPGDGQGAEHQCTVGPGSEEPPDAVGQGTEMISGEVPTAAQRRPRK